MTYLLFCDTNHFVSFSCNSQQDIEAFREEIERRQLSEGISPSKAIESNNGQVDDESNSQVSTCS